MSGISETAANRPLTILFAPAHTLVDENQFGSEYYWAYKLIQRLALDYNVRIIALTIQPRVTHELPGVRFLSVDPDGSLPVTNLDSLRFHLRCYGAARKILRSGQHIDVIHHMLPFGFRSTFNLLALFRRPLDPPIVIGPLQPPYAHTGAAEWQVTASYSSASQLLQPPPPPQISRTIRASLFMSIMTLVVKPALTTLSALTLYRAGAIVTVSELGVRRYRSYARFKAYSIIPPGVDTTEFYPATMADRAEARKTGRPITIIACGRLTRRKAFDTLLRAMAQVIQAGMDVRLRLIGDGPEQANLEKLAEQLIIRHYVTFVGSVAHDTVAREYRKGDIFCSPSLGEGFATVALEALASGLPIVATPTGGFRELLGRHQVGVLTPFNAIDELASALTMLIADPARREAMGLRARDIAVHEYDWGVIAGRYISLYQKAIEQHDR